jgi:putative ABC transport system permease protein
MNAWRPLLRLAVRDARRDRWRTLLIVGAVALPVAGLVGAIALFDTFTPTPQDRATAQLGAADLGIMLGGLPPDADPLADLAARLPGGTALQPLTYADDELVLPGRRDGVLLAAVPLTDDTLAAGMYQVVDGRAPAGPDEAAVARALAERSDLELGDEITFATHPSVEVVGIALPPDATDARLVLVAPGSLSAAGTVRQVLVGLPDGTTGASLHTTLGQVDGVIATVLREEILAHRYEAGERWAATIIGGLAVVEVALIAGAAFAVSTRRRQRELGLLAAVGGSRRDVRRVVLLTGAAAGVVGTLVGVAVAGLAVVVGMPWFRSISERALDGPRFDAPWIVGVALLGVVAAVLGAWLPARAVARLPVTTALAGRRPTAAPSSRTLVAGLVLVVAGVALVGLAVTVGVVADGGLVFLLGVVLVVLGAGLASPWLLEQLGRLAPHLPVGPRLALRDAARFRTRNGPIVTAAMAGLAATVTVSAVFVSLDTSMAASYEPSFAREHLVIQAWSEQPVAEQVAATLGGTPIDVLDAGLQATSAVEGSPSPETFPDLGGVAVGTPALAAALGGQPLVDALAGGRVVVLNQEVEQVRLTRWDQTGESPVSDLVVTADDRLTVLHLPDGVPTPWSGLPTVLVPPDLVAAPTPVRHAVLVVLDEPLTVEGYETAQAMVTAADPDSWMSGELGHRTRYATQVQVVVIAGALVGLALVAVALALAATEARSDQRTLAAVGASAATRRSLAAGRALVLAGLAGVLAVPVGLLPAYAALLAFAGAGLTVPWATVAIVTLGVPLVATAGAAIAARREPPDLLRTAA